MIKWLNKKSISKVELIIILILLGLASLFGGATMVLKTGLRSNYVTGESMEKTLSSGSKVLFIHPDFKPIKRGDIVSVEAYENDEKVGLIKRVIGMPGETIRIDKDKVYINGVLLEESYAFYSDSSTDDLTITLAEDSYFLMGDNRLNSLDSRDFGPIPRKLITDVVISFRK